MLRPLLFIFLQCMALAAAAQISVQITIFNESADQPAQLTEQFVREELETLLRSRYLADITTIQIDDLGTFEAELQRVYAGDSDLVIALGFGISNLLAQRGQYAKPTIIPFILDNELQGLPAPVDGRSGIDQLTYIQSPFDLRRDLETLYAIKPFRKLAIITDAVSNGRTLDFRSYLDRLLAFSGASYELMVLEKSEASVLDQIGEDVDAAFLFPVVAPEKFVALRNTLDGLARKGIPTFSLLSDPAMELGAYAAFETGSNFDRIPRRVALNALKILEGQAAADLPVAMESFTENLLINMETARKTRYYPSWDLMSKAILLNVSVIGQGDRTLTFSAAIAEALQTNLGIKVAEKDVQIVGRDVSIARSNYLPQVDASGTFFTVDENTVNRSFGTQGRYNLTTSAKLTQLILSEPALANIAIQKFLLASEEQSLRESELDVVLDVSQAYLGILQARALVDLRNQNVAVTRKNLDIAQNKEEVGFSGVADVYRLQSELARNNADLNSALAQLRQSRFNLNNLLNRPIKEDFGLADVGLSDSILLANDSRLFGLINNPGDLERFADFLVAEAFKNLPEIGQVQAALAAQERSRLSQRRAFYLPSLVLSGEYNYPLGQYSFPETVMPMDLVPTYSAAIGLQIPIFQGNARRFELEQTEVGILQLQDQLQNLRNGLELQVRANLEMAGASFSNVRLSNEAVEASRKNFELAQDSYQQGLLNITSLVDAQNALLQSEINAITAEYTFISDFLAVERAIGYYHNLALPQEQDAFFQRFVQFIKN
ncbi:MAG: TolC family protein [Bacteroidota bacterium]